MTAFIKAISYALPNIVVTNQDLANAFPEWSVDKIAKKVGITSRHVVSEGQCASDLAEQAANKLFTTYGIDKECIDFLLLCTQSPDYFLPTTACLLQDRLGLSTRCGALDFNLGCSGFVYGLALAKGLIEGRVAQNVLLITAETYSKHIDKSDKGNRAIFGDAAAATLVSIDGFAEIGNFDLGTDGSGAANLMVKSGGMRDREGAEPLFMNGSEIFGFTLDTVPELVDRVLRKNGLERSSIDLFVFHQANKYLLENLYDLMEVDVTKTFDWMSEVGNTVSSTIPIALCEAQKAQRLDGTVLIAGFGVGYSWGACVLTCKP